MNLKKYSTEEIIKLIKENKISVADIVDSGICPTCFNKENNNILYRNNIDKIIYEDNQFECFLVRNPRANGHTAISTKIHYKDMMEINDDVCKDIFIFEKNNEIFKRCL